jgi:ketosteroid isomerase-like protein
LASRIHRKVELSYGAALAALRLCREKSVFVTTFIAATAIVAAATVAPASSGTTAQSQIRAALENWTAQFNAGNADVVCDLFARDLISDYQGQPERDYDSQCALLRKSLSDKKHRFQYFLNIKEIMVSGDLAIVRLVWTLHVEQEDPPLTRIVLEPGLDVFRRQPDGSWKIARYLAYDATAQPQ